MDLLEETVKQGDASNACANVNFKQTDLKGQKQKIEKLLER